MFFSPISDLFRIEQLRRFWINGKEKLIKLNIFHSNHPEIIVDEHELKTQIISTRVFLILLIIPLLILAVYTSEVPITTTITVDSPSYDKYSRMYSQYSRSLSCPCTTISIPYNQFLDVQVARFHQVCQSVYVTTDWSTIIDNAHLHQTIFPEDFRKVGGRLFQTLASFCDQSREIITDDLIKFNAQRLITTNVMALDLFESQSKSYIQLFISSTKSSFKLSIDLVSELTQGNVLFPGLVSNLQLNLVAESAEDVFLRTIYTKFISNSSNCSCQETPTCVTLATIFYNMSYAPTPVIRFVVPGIMRGCYIVEAFLQSNLVCFYNQSCVNDLRYVLNTTTIKLNDIIELNTTALDPSVRSQFEINSTLGDIVNELMVEEWINTSSHKSYYAACNPKTCTYSIVGKKNLAVVISTIIGLLGSLTTILTIIVPIIVRKFRLCFRNRVDITTEHETPIPMRLEV
jgi:hypothetical protein